MLKIHKNVWFFLLHFILKQRFSFLFLGLISIACSVCANVIWPTVVGNLVDVLNSLEEKKEGAIKILTYPLIATLLFLAFLELTQRVKGMTMALIIPKFEANLRMFLFKHVAQLSHSFFINKHKGGIANRISDMPKSAKLIVDDVITVFIPVIMSIIVSSMIYFSLNHILALIFFSWLSLHFILAVWFGSKASNYSSSQSATRALVQGKIVDSIFNHLIVKIFNRKKYEIDDTQKIQNEEVKKYKFSLIYIEKFKLLLSLQGIFFSVLLFWYSFHLWEGGEISLGEVIFIVNSTVSLMGDLWFVGDEISYVFYELGVCKQSLKLLQEPVEFDKSVEKQDLVVRKGDIEFDKVTFNYQDNDNLFENKSLVIKGKQKIGLVGFSGSGKTTFVNLIMRLYDDFRGEIKIDGNDIKELSLDSLRENIALIPQESVLFHRSIEDNIRYGKLDATHEEIVEVAKKAGCHDFIMKLEKSYKTVVGESGGKLSGGQRQRLSIARAILKDAPIIIMDEATSGLDAVTERLVTKSIETYVQNKTFIVIAHKLSTLLNMDRILVFNKGDIIEDGSHEELLKKKGHYSMLWNMQNGGFLPEHDTIKEET